MPTKKILYPILLLLLWMGSYPALPGVQAQGQAPILSVLDRQGHPLNKLVDGNTVRLQLSLSDPAPEESRVEFDLEGLGGISGCTLPAGAKVCASEPVDTLGWYWDPGGTPRPTRVITTRISGSTLQSRAEVTVAPRPVVMVHGFLSNPSAWQKYLGANGYLAELGIPAFAVGDGQLPGVMNTGNLVDPTQPTHTLAQNAAILSDYLAAVKQATGAEQVDLLGHSMGGLIGRYYIDRLMQGRDVAQLLMLGTPQDGSACADLPAALGYYLPAALEIQPGYVVGVFNPQITHRHGVPFFALAGTKILAPVQSPCTTVPSDIAVSLASASAIPLDLEQFSALHVELNTSRQVFETFVRPHLQTPAGQLHTQPDPAPASASPAEEIQFTRVYTGHVSVGATPTLSIPIDAQVTVAAFGLFDPTRSLTVTVQGASGNTIPLSPAANGLIVIDDPSTLIYLGYGFANPRPGVWKVTLHPTAQTPPGGADFALTARMEGGARLDAQAAPLLPRLDESVQVSLALSLAGQPVAIDAARATLRRPGGAAETLALTPLPNNSLGLGGSWKPTLAGLHALEIQVTAHAPDGTAIERSAFLSVEAQTAREQTQGRIALSGVGILLLCGLGVLALLVLGAGAWLRFGRKKIP